MAEEIIILLDNPHFRLWVLSPSKSGDNYWSKIMAENPKRVESIDKARLMLIALDKEFGDNFPASETINSMLRNILNSK